MFDCSSECQQIQLISYVLKAVKTEVEEPDLLNFE